MKFRNSGYFCTKFRGGTAENVQWIGDGESSMVNLVSSRRQSRETVDTTSMWSWESMHQPHPGLWKRPPCLLCWASVFLSPITS